MSRMNSQPLHSSRREFLLRAGAGFGGIALSSILARRAQAETVAASSLPHAVASARHVIYCFMDGGPSHIDLFDPKPALKRYAGQALPSSFKRPVTAMGVTAANPLLASPRVFRQHGQSGLAVSDWLPEIAKCADDLAVIRSCTAEGLTHVAGMYHMNTGSILPGRPSLGSWAIYGLGSECEDLPAFVVLSDSSNSPPGGSSNWGPGFMPATYQGTRFADGDVPILYAKPPAEISDARNRSKIDFINQMNHRYASRRKEHDAIDAQIHAYELAYRMQSSVPEAVDFARESAATRKLYGFDDPDTDRNARNCLLARRLVERGVRFVQLYMGAGSRWDAHSDLDSNHAQLCRESDRPIAGLLKDLKSRGLLESTLVIWGGEFGRTPMSESGDGRDHNPTGFTMWMAGGGIKGGTTHGATDELGLYAVDKPVNVHDIHATILHLLGLDHKALTFLHDGRHERLTVTAGEPILEIVA